MRITKDNQTELIIRPSLRFVIAGWLLLLVGLGIIGGGLVSGTLWAYLIVGLSLVFLGFYLVGLNTQIHFNQPPGHITVTQGSTLFLWFGGRKVIISREEPRSLESHITMYKLRHLDGIGGEWKYGTIVAARAGTGEAAKLLIHLLKEGGLGELTSHVIQRIRDFSDQYGAAPAEGQRQLKA